MSDDGKECCEGQTAGQYLRNRLERAFLAGANSSDEQIKELEAEIAKRPAKPLFGEVRSNILKAMDNSANIGDAIDKYDKLQERIKELQALMQRVYDCIPKGSSLQKKLEQALKGGK